VERLSVLFGRNVSLSKMRLVGAVIPVLALSVVTSAGTVETSLQRIDSLLNEITDELRVVREAVAGDSVQAQAGVDTAEVADTGPIAETQTVEREDVDTAGQQKGDSLVAEVAEPESDGGEGGLPEGMLWGWAEVATSPWTTWRGTSILGSVPASHCTSDCPSV